MSKEMEEAIAAGDGTLHGAIDYWQDRAEKAEAEALAALVRKWKEEAEKQEADWFIQAHRHAKQTTSHDLAELQKRVKELEQSNRLHALASKGDIEALLNAQAEARELERKLAELEQAYRIVHDAMNIVKEEREGLESKLAEQQALLHKLGLLFGNESYKFLHETGFEELNTLLAQAREEGRKEAVLEGKFKLGDHVRKTKGSRWQGKIVGHYSTSLTPEGYAVESDTETGSVQIYPATALELLSAAPEKGD